MVSVNKLPVHPDRLKVATDWELSESRFKVVEPGTLISKVKTSPALIVVCAVMVTDPSAVRVGKEVCPLIQLRSVITNDVPLGRSTNGAHLT